MDEETKPKEEEAVEKPKPEMYIQTLDSRTNVITRKINIAYLDTLSTKNVGRLLPTLRGANWKNTLRYYNQRKIEENRGKDGLE